MALQFGEPGNGYAPCSEEFTREQVSQGQAQEVSIREEAVGGAVARDGEHSQNSAGQGQRVETMTIIQL
jgi:hypothetical protein